MEGLKTATGGRLTNLYRWKAYSLAVPPFNVQSVLQYSIYSISFTVFNLLNQFYSIRSTSSGGHEINVADVCKDDQFCLHYPRVEQFGSREIKQMPPVRQRLGLN